MSNMQINSVLAQIRSMQSQIRAPAPLRDDIATPQATQPVSGSRFSDLLKNGLDAVNQSQQTADGLVTAFQRGTPGVELADVMIEMQKANVSFRAATEVRNRMVSAYQEIMNMQI
ncbi:MAG TPA: flagellar hook-basal body complex protein FliE [Steroidobacteraceae bacterium]|nr:flagellar hook-basal body complex protein FliE [Steroidobacteraceae bacterium]